MADGKLKACEEALERLIVGETVNVDANSYDEITFGLIEREAGTVSKGYIKQDRDKFKAIVDRLKDHKATVASQPAKKGKSVLQKQNEKLQQQKEKDAELIKELTYKLHIMMADNLKLVERGRELEKENLALKSGKIIPVQMGSRH
ncbi:hypothetical protein [Alteromonas lipotrueiana]|uniref:hypothetical protein n=1 Tax=Alteromonas lipotrueiana TaxID=2803815 RepID=UPI001C46689D|nr:hypothetical protein [Alteromonas lipotrueiana]